MHGLTIAEIFRSVQGEGPSLGQLCAFVRLGGCNLTCGWCDTKYTRDWKNYDPQVELKQIAVPAILEQLDGMAIDRVVITGGEPLLQQANLLELLREIKLNRGWFVEIETNGTMAPWSSVVPLVSQWNVSPKLSNSGVSHSRRWNRDALSSLMKTGKAIFKFVVCTVDDLDEVAEVARMAELSPIWIMPEGTHPMDLARHGSELYDAAIARGWNITTRLHVWAWGGKRGK